MKRWIALGVFLVLTAAPAVARGQGSAADETALRDLGKQYEAAWNASDATKIGSFFVDDGTWLGEWGTVTQGRAAIEKDFAQVKASDLKGAKLTSTTDTVRFIRPDLALTRGSYSISCDGAPEPFKGHYLAVATKQGGSWKLVAVHTAAMPAMPPPPSSK